MTFWLAALMLPLYHEHRWHPCVMQHSLHLAGATGTNRCYWLWANFVGIEESLCIKAKSLPQANGRMNPRR